MKNLGIFLLSIWLIATGILPLLNISFSSSAAILALLAIAAGIIMLVDLRQSKLANNLGMLLLSLWLIAASLLPLFGISFPARDTVLALLAAIAGLLLLLKQ